MALINCQECGKEISDKAVACVHCGCPIEKEAIVRTEPYEESIVLKYAHINSAEYKGVGGGSIVINGNNLYIKQMFIKEDCTFDDIIDVKFKEHNALRFSVEIKTQKHSSVPHSVIFSNYPTATELYELLIERTSGLDLVRHQPAQHIPEKGTDDIARCPKCGSTSLSGNKKGFGIGKAVVGAALTGGIGLMAGNIGAKKVRVTCLKCGKQWWAGK